MSAKVIHFTHNDADAVGCDYFLRLSLVNFYSLSEIDDIVDTKFCGNDNIDKIIKETLEEYQVTRDLWEVSRIIISDIGPTEETLVLLEEYQEQYKFELLGFDHHPTNVVLKNPGLHPWFLVRPSISKEEFNSCDVCVDIGGRNVDDLDEFLVSPTRRYFVSSRKISATYLLARYFWHDIVNIPNGVSIDFLNKTFIFSSKLSRIVWMFSDYDTWEWKQNPIDLILYDVETRVEAGADIGSIICKKMSPKNMVSAMIIQLGYLFSHSDVLLYAGTNEFLPSSFYLLYKYEKDAELQYMLRTLPSVRMLENFKLEDIPDAQTVLGPVAVFIAGDGYPNALCDFINNKCEVRATVVLYPGTMGIGLRTAANNLDLGSVAANLFHGGGHPQAAGGKFKTPDEIMFRLHQFYYDAVPLDDYLKSHGKNYSVETLKKDLLTA